MLVVLCHLESFPVCFSISFVQFCVVLVTVCDFESFCGGFLLLCDFFSRCFVAFPVTVLAGEKVVQ